MTPTIPPRWFRTIPDSASLTASRVLIRRLIPLVELDVRINDYELLQHCYCDLRMPIPDFGGLELAAIGGVLLIASERPFTDIQRRTHLSLIVADLDTQLTIAGSVGAQILEPSEDILPGRRARIRYPGDVITELVEHRPLPGEHPYPRPVTGIEAERSVLLRLNVDRRAYSHCVQTFEQVIGSSAVHVARGPLAQARIDRLIIAARAPDSGTCSVDACAPTA